jgi:transcriptional regulator with XRE-family HTH domain
MTDDDIERIEEGGTEPTIPLLRRLAAALNADVRLTGGHDLGSVWFETHAALRAVGNADTAPPRAGMAISGGNTSGRVGWLGAADLVYLRA